MGECDGSEIRCGSCEQEELEVRCLVVVRISCVEIRGEELDLPLHERDANLGVRR